MTAVFYKADRFTLLDHGHFWFSERPERPGSRAWGAWWPRMCTWVELRDDRTGQSFFTFNAHLSSASANARQRSAELLRERVELLAHGSPVVVLGDFNTDADTGPHRTLTAGGTLTDTHQAVFPFRSDDENTRHRFLGYTRGERIDWVLASPDLTVVTAGILNQKINGQWVSDHFPVAAELTLPAERRPILADVRFEGDPFAPAR